VIAKFTGALPVRRFLLFTGIKMWWAAGRSRLENNPALKWIRSRFKIAPGYDGENSLRGQRVKMATPLLVVILLVAS